jgi:hypothetical protein
VEYQVIAKAIKNLKVACLVDKSNYQGSVADPISILEILTEDIAKELDEEEVIKFKDMCEIC